MTRPPVGPAYDDTQTGVIAKSCGFAIHSLHMVRFGCPIRAPPGTPAGDAIGHPAHHAGFLPGTVALIRPRVDHLPPLNRG